MFPPIYAVKMDRFAPGTILPLGVDHCTLAEISGFGMGAATVCIPPLEKPRMNTRFTARFARVAAMAWVMKPTSSIPSLAALPQQCPAFQ